MSNILNIGNEKLSVLQDPFNKSGIVRVGVSSSILPTWKLYSFGSVDFKSGKTEGTQKFEGSSFDDVVLQIKAFIDTLEE